VFITFAQFQDAKKEGKYTKWQKQGTKGCEARAFCRTKANAIQLLQNPNCQGSNTRSHFWKRHEDFIQL
jgi:hypothetical protein